MFNIGVHHEPAIRNDSYAHRWSELLQQKGHNVIRMNFKPSGVVDEIRGRKCHGVMWHWVHSADDKQIAPKIESWVFWDIESAMDFLRSAKYPMVFKLSVGAGSSNVIKIDSEAQASALAKKMFSNGIFPYTLNQFSNSSVLRNTKNTLRRIRHIFSNPYPLPHYFPGQKSYLYLQDFLPGNSHDIRITVIGNRAFGYIRHNRPGDFLASGSGNFDPDPDLIPQDAVRIAHRVSKQLNCQSMAYDFLAGPHGDVLLNEISYCYLNWMVHDCPGHWDDVLNWREGHVWPEEAHAEGFLAALSESQ